MIIKKVFLMLNFQNLRLYSEHLSNVKLSEFEIIIITFSNVKLSEFETVFITSF
jgi:hypothetical protein